MSLPASGRPALGALLSFLFPGLGQLSLGWRRSAAAFGVPVAALVVAAGAAWLIDGRGLVSAALSPTGLLTLAVLNVALLGWRLAAVIHAGLAAPRQTAAVALVTVLAIGVLAVHAWTGLVIGNLGGSLDRIFQGGVPSTSPAPLNEPDFRWDGTERINVLLLGVDAGVGRVQALTDSIVVVSVDPVEHTAVMVSVPRDMGFVPLPDRSVYPDGVYPQKINQLSTDANREPERWCPDLRADADCGLRTLERSIGLFLGIEVHYYARVDLQGFADLIDAVGGLTLCLPGRLVDPEYGGPTWPERGIVLEEGCHHYDGPHALAFARIRKGHLELPDGSVQPQNDFLRAERQQEVLLELRRELAQLDVIFELPTLIRAIGDTLSTDFPREQVGDLATLLPLVSGPSIERLVLRLPEFAEPPVDPETNYLLIPRREAIREEMQRLFGASLQGWYLGSEADGPPS